MVGNEMVGVVGEFGDMVGVVGEFGDMVVVEDRWPPTRPTDPTKAYLG